MAIISLKLLQQVISPHITSFENHIVKAGIKPTRILRVLLSYECGRSGTPSVIVKDIAPHWPDDPASVDRERLFLNDLYSHLDIRRVHIYHASIDTQTQHRVIVMEDLTSQYRFPPPTHTWNWDEICCTVRTYARLHASGRECVPPKDGRAWMFRLQETPWDPEELSRMAANLVVLGRWGRLSGLDRLIDQTMTTAKRMVHYPVTIIHNDVYPTNIGLPFDLTDEAILIDWEMVGWGMAELDLAYMFMLPFRNTRNICRDDVSDYYWAQRQALEGRCPPVAERRAAQRQADALWALFLIRVAHRVALQPFPSGSAPQAYWNAMFGVLYERLTALCN